MSNYLFEEETYKIIGILFEVHKNLGKGFSEIVYKDALEFEFNSAKIPFEREKEYSVNYKDIILKHKFYADFVVFDKIILEIKSCDSFVDSHIAQCINYLKVSDNKLALLVNFNKKSVDYKRIINSK
jgi:GxxExxY protein